VPVGVDQDPHIRLTRGLVNKTNWFNIKTRKSGGLTIGLSIQDENKFQMGVLNSGGVNSQVRGVVFEKLQISLSQLGFADVLTNPKHGTLEIPGATISDMARIKLSLLSLERSMGGMGLMPPCSTYHRFAVGMTGDKMSSSKPETTIFMRDTVEEMSKKVKRAYSGGQATIEEHRRLGGNLSKDVAYQYLQFFFEESDSELHSIGRDYESGRLLAGEIKQICVDKASEWLTDLSEKRNQWADRIDEFLAPDSK
jgi:tryptophanyl-tRNA synthetase